MTRLVSVARLRPRLVATFALVAALTSAAVAVTSYFVTREAVLRRAETEARTEAEALLVDATETLPPAAGRAQVLDLLSRLKARAGAELDVVAVYDDGGFDTTSISLSAASVPAALAGPVGSGRIGMVRASRAVVVGGRPAGGPAFYVFFPLDDVAADLDLLRNVLAGVGAGAVLLSAVVGALAARGLLRPLRQARTAAHRLEVGLLGTRLPEGGGDEFADLGHAFNRMAEALEASIADLRGLEASHRRFVADVSHELRTPLTALTTAADVLDAHRAGLDDAGNRAAGLLVRESHRLAVLVEDLMEISRLDAGAAPMAWEQVDVAALVNGAVATRGWAGRVQVDTPDGGGVTTVADPRRLDAIVANLVGNALEHGRPPVGIRVAAPTDEVVVEVADAGDGIAAEHLPRIFDRFYKADPARPGGHGSGLGLAIARENARLHGGDLTVASPPGSGAVFTLRVPRRVAEPLPAGDATVTTAPQDRVP